MDIFISALAYIDYTTILVVVGAFIWFICWSNSGLTSTMAICFNEFLLSFLIQFPALALMISVGASSIFYGDISRALLNIPGTPASAAYTNDAHTFG